MRHQCNIGKRQRGDFAAVLIICNRLHGPGQYFRKTTFLRRKIQLLLQWTFEFCQTTIDAQDGLVDPLATAI
jgi:hypothetical protein